jgi:hypothetical protein
MLIFPRERGTFPKNREPSEDARNGWENGRESFRSAYCESREPTLRHESVGKESVGAWRRGSVSAWGCGSVGEHAYVLRCDGVECTLNRSFWV